MRLGSDGIDQALVTWEGFSQQTWESIISLPDITAEIADYRAEQLADAESELAKLVANGAKMRATLAKTEQAIERHREIVAHRKLRSEVAAGVRDTRAARKNRAARAPPK